MAAVMIQTSLGNMTVTFFEDKAPEHVKNFRQLAADAFYNNTTFHRVVEGFMIQGGCPRGDGTGNGPRRLQAEFNDVPHVRGTLSMARTQDPNSASCQFFICLEDARFLDGQYTALGQIEGDDSLATLDKIGGVEVKDSGTGEKSEPVEPVIIERMVVLEDA
jgi:cyclophilin family peptidyl-prolyl cis-trans isomerase